MNDRTTTKDKAFAAGAAFTAYLRESGEAFRAKLREDGEAFRASCEAFRAKLREDGEAFRAKTREDAKQFTVEIQEDGEAFHSDLSAAIREEAKRFVEDMDRGFKTLCIIFVAGWASVMIGLIGLFIKG